MEKKYSLLDWILGIALMILIGYALMQIEKLSEYFVELVNPSKNKDLYRDIGTGIILLLTGLTFLGLSIKLKDDSFLQRLSSALFYLNGIAFIFYLFYIIIRIFNSL